MHRILATFLLVFANTSFADEYVRQAQILLDRFGFDVGKPDGIMGRRTESGLRDFLQSRGITYDGKFDVEDLQLLKDEASSAGFALAPISGFEIENAANTRPIVGPEKPGATKNRYMYGHFQYAADWNKDGRLDFLYTGTFFPENNNPVGEDTGGQCGGDACRGEMPGPSLFLQQPNGTFEDASQLFHDERETPGQSLSRQNLVADFNGDGRLDLFIADTGVGTHNGFRDSYFLSQSDGTWLESSRTHLSNSNYKAFDHGGAVGDIDGDGDIDIVLTELADKLTCWMNDGRGYLRKRTCGRVNAFGIELGDIDGDGDLDLVHAGHEFEGSTPTGIALNDGSGQFGREIRLPQVANWGTVPEVSVWDLDDDGDLDVVLSRAGKLYVGTGVQIVENLGNGKFSTVFYPLIEAPSTFRPSHEGNEWNNYIDTILFRDVDRDGDSDIVFLGGGFGENSKRIRGAIMRNEGSMRFTHIPNGRSGNSVTILQESKFPSAEIAFVESPKVVTGTSRRTSASQAFKRYVQVNPLESVAEERFLRFSSPILLGNSGASIVGIANSNFSGNNGSFDLFVDWGDQLFGISICVQYYPEYTFTGFRTHFGGRYGFGGIRSLDNYATNSCVGRRGGAVGAWEIEDQTESSWLKSILQDLQDNGRALIAMNPEFSEGQRAKILEVFR